MGKTKIQWTQGDDGSPGMTWNPITGCSRVSEGCRNCYAERFAHRFSGKGQRYEGLTHIANGHPTWTGKIQFNEEALLKPLRWKRPRRIFVNSMSDLFHENVTDEQRDRIFAVMALCPQHTFQVLTKRPERMLTYFSGFNTTAAEVRAMNTCAWVAETVAKPPQAWIDLVECIPRGLPNGWLGVSVENQKTADERIPFLLNTPAAVRFISAEPLLDSVDLFNTFSRCTCKGRDDIDEDCPGEYQLIDGLNWVICGGESGPGARRMEAEWARSLRDQCKTAGVPFFFKQWGAWWPNEQGNYSCSEELRQLAYDEPGEEFSFVGARKAGDLLDGVQYHEYPKVFA